MENKFSIVLPTYNRLEQLTLTLASFENQNFDKQKFEIIVVDDCSSDGTQEFLANYSPPFQFRYFSSGERRGGQGNARNLGATQAKGEYIIFCDSDFLVVPEFLNIFNKLFLQYPNHVISGTPYCFTRVFTQYYPNFSDGEKKKLRSFLSKTKIRNKSLLESKQIIQIITPEVLKADFSKLNHVILGEDNLGDKLRKEFLNTDVAPWLLFITRCVALSRKTFFESGGFDERIIRGEDWELGYRLYRKGVHFTSVGETVGFHQEHPSSFRNEFGNAQPFNKIIFEKYGLETLELSLLSIWDSSDELWKNIIPFKKLLRISKHTNEFETDKTKTLLKDFLLKSCEKATQRWNWGKRD
ncbi:glycosyltransferase family 2 protein [Bacillus sp. ISL-46]|uniref:glycosyltransferase family 2 protein n=1 Tax=Bacillus sp. ISL-46 TaxID=2819129 RepID=UPI001BEA2037|nr:glycosyltransferase family 2 protein [Bacillus sp. ISL-46]MBT2724655.1 glycosyltransferase family 2 protein [Bacillus sp. ISL-46]